MSLSSFHFVAEVNEKQIKREQKIVIYTLSLEGKFVVMDHVSHARV